MFPLSVIPNVSSVAASASALPKALPFTNTKSLKLDGVDQSFAFPSKTDCPTALIDGRGEGTISFWFWLKSLTVGLIPFLSRGSGSSYLRIFMDHNNQDISIIGLDNGAISVFTQFDTSTALVARQWHHCAITFDKNSIWSANMYIDGTLMSVATGFNGSGSINAGVGVDTVGRDVNGVYGLMQIDEFAVWQNVLTAQEITELQSHYNLLEDEGDYSSSSSLSTNGRWYRFEDDATDETGNGGDLVYNNNPAYQTSKPF